MVQVTHIVNSSQQIIIQQSNRRCEAANCLPLKSQASISGSKKSFISPLTEMAHPCSFSKKNGPLIFPYQNPHQSLIEGALASPWWSVKALDSPLSKLKTNVISVLTLIELWTVSSWGSYAEFSSKKSKNIQFLRTMTGWWW